LDARRNSEERKKEGIMKKFILIAVLLIAVVAVLFGFRQYRKEKPLVLSGSIEARDVQVGSLVGGRVLQVHVDEGNKVKKGDVIVTLDPSLLDLQIQQQKSVINQAKANSDRVRRGPRSEELTRAKLEWNNSERERQRLESLYQQGVIGRQQLDDAATKSETAKEAYRELQRGSRLEDIQAAEAELDRQQNALAYLIRQKEETIVISPVNGTIETLDLRPGDLVTPNQPVARILEPDQLWVRVYLPEPKLGLIHEGQAVDITVDTFPNKKFHGRIVEISNQGEYTPRNIQTEQQRMDQVFGVKVEIQLSSELKPGMAATVQLTQ
jgi:HlyD family secretion protein